MNPCCVYDFTLPYKYRIESVKNWLNKISKKWCFQLERGESGYYHYQGRFSLKVKSRLNNVYNPGKAHLSITSNENSGNDFYVTKIETRIKGPWSNKDIEIPDDIDGIELYQWQKDVLNGKRNKRKINVIYNEAGGIGKSTLLRYALVHELASWIPAINDYKDIMRIAYDCPVRPIYIIDMPKAMKKDKLSQLYTGIEHLKDGIIFDDRYHFKYKVIRKPEVWVFTNTYPKLDYLSKDKWKIWVVQGGALKAFHCNSIIKAPEQLEQNSYDIHKYLDNLSMPNTLEV